MTTVAVFLAEPALLANVAVGDTVTVTGSEARHAGAARRLRPSEIVDLVDGVGTRARGPVVVADGMQLRVSVAELFVEPPPQPTITVVQALAKGDRAEAAVEMLTECGVDRIVPWAAERSVVRWDPRRAERGVQRWQAIASAATKQARRSWVPRIEAPARTSDVVTVLGAARLGLVLHESATARLARLALPADPGEIVILVGPEGGLSPSEVAAFEAAGALSVRLGSSVLRTSTAGVAAAAVVSAACGRWD